MLKNYFKIDFRNIWVSKNFSSVNIVGLALGIASALFILIWIRKELSYDQFPQNKDYLYEAWNRAELNGKVQCWEKTPNILGPTLKQVFPEVAEIARGNSRWFVTSVGEKKRLSKALITDPSFLSMFSFPLLRGDFRTALNKVYAIVITQKMSRKMFGQENAIGKLIRINKDDFTVSGILKDLPANTSFDFEYLLPWSYMIKLGQDDHSWGSNSINTYVLLKPNCSEKAADEHIKDITIKQSHGEEPQEVFLHPLSKWHLYSDFENGKIVGGRIETVRLFGIIACCILLIAFVNFMNLGTGRNQKRSKGLKTRKVSGANRGALIRRFLSDPVMIVLISSL